MSITHTEVRRHPRWQEQVNAHPAAPASTSFGVRLISVVALLIVATTVFVILRG